ncbi:Superoxide dismutase protein [Rutstroemia sp. NJR-2017a WRK4]|nr:Superoxide dismutase protein [Rutstroemia sp. NJR-2017a WRK4]
MFRSRFPRIPIQRLPLKRSFANYGQAQRVPTLKHDFSKGVPGLLSPPAFDIAWTQYQTLMLEKLNQLLAGTEYAHKDPKDILLKYARDPNYAPHFNHASMAHNNHFFFDSLSPKAVPMPEKLKEELERCFSSIETFRQELILTASAMFGPGFVWVVKDRMRDFRILNTYIAGSPYQGAHYRRQPVDMNTEDSSISEHIRRTQGNPVNSVGAHGPHSATREEKLSPPGGTGVTPILCINMWEHVWLPDFGFFHNGNGKRSYAEEWWNHIDWNVVSDRADISKIKFQR